MKIKMIFASMLAAVALAGCSNDSEPGNTNSGEDDGVVAYVALNVQTPVGKGTRSAEEAASAEESAVKTLHAIAFDNSYKVSVLKNVNAVQEAELVSAGGDLKTPQAFKVSSSAKYLLLIANPGTEVAAMLSNVTKGMHFNVLNEAITAANIENEILSGTADKGFTMINSGISVELTNSSAPALLCLADISAKIKLVENEEDEDQVKAAAENDRVTINIERLAAKVGVAEKTGGADVTLKDGGQGKFTFIGWVLDATNAKFYPWAKKINTGSSVTGGTNYTNNFYTMDANFANNEGLRYNKVVNGVPSTPEAVALTWLTNAKTYCAENTMEASEQRFMNATRVIIKSTYYPNTTWTGDWFSYAGTNYENLAALQVDYAKENKVNFRASCDKFYAKVKAAKPTITAANFAALTESDLASVANGGEIVKEDECIRWYQNGLNYYWYEIRHDSNITAPMAFMKYGVVRNNWYELTINSVKNSGTPWYPIVDPKDPNKDKEPEPTDPIDEVPAYIGVSVKVMPWIQWQHGIDL